MNSLTTIWIKPELQQFPSSHTSINSKKVPAVFRFIEKYFGWSPRTVNADIGGGKYDTATEYLAKFGVENIIYDPYNRSNEHNLWAADKIRDGQSNTAVVSCVLNVIKEHGFRELVIWEAANALVAGGLVFFKIYQGNKSCVGKATGSDRWQENRPAATYLPEIASAPFHELMLKSDIIIARRLP